MAGDETTKFGAYPNTAWETCQATGEQCLLDFSNTSDPLAFTPLSTCAQGSVPNYYIGVQNPEDVSVALNFSRTTGIPLVVKNTGISYNSSFTPEGCSQAGISAVTFGAGVTFRSLYAFADAQNITIIGGTDDSIAAGGGYLMGGGHSAFSNSLGLTVDHALEFEVVTPDGQHRIANSCVNSDLFFALRGGGGGTLGVVLQITIRAFPGFSFSVLQTVFMGVPSIEIQREFVKFLIDNALPWASKGWGGYIEAGYLLFLHYKTRLTFPAWTRSDLNGTFVLQEETSWLSFFNQFVAPTGLPDGLPSAVGSRLIPATVFDSESQKAALLDIVMSAVPKHATALLFPVAPYFFKGDDQTILNPAWRSSLWHNEAYLFESNFSNTSAISMTWLQANITVEMFWGPNYPELLRIKEKYDPYHLMDCWRCVGWNGPSAARFGSYP
ncbi:uncharacterized protein PHACADRAFT_198375 [Phanerochaete carnosa HHB-10118-sp]|uniref:FAD-binding PCMH-type domain-containing protein n=1 Tax=Phanerochaete carnosa (strain HHB-10118-sp) TaxID=650164 RepID=K5W0D4_PHACS|nr:uncharacterized protein PHACADRAFT_198375 [Phanerochaete carnosa HHB-10118-sp]EKM52309.1 hypothetical protein PHACADRAFT_198375 [Phanerochaete carnosa HHB-10118-sp]